MQNVGSVYVTMIQFKKVTLTLTTICLLQNTNKLQVNDQNRKRCGEKYLSVFLNRQTDCHIINNTEIIMTTTPMNTANPQSLCRPHLISVNITVGPLKFHVPLAPSKQWPSNSCKFSDTGIKIKKDPRNDTKKAIT